MGEAMDAALREGVGAVVFGDLFLEDVRRYRTALAPTGIVPVFPLWARPTEALAGRQFVRPGSVQSSRAWTRHSSPRPSSVGTSYDELLRELPTAVDPCGERGEFHTFVWDAPLFSAPIPIRTGRGSPGTASTSATCSPEPGGNRLRRAAPYVGSVPLRCIGHRRVEICGGGSRQDDHHDRHHAEGDGRQPSGAR